VKLSQRPYLLLILDGWGYSTKQAGNAIAQAKTPTWDRLWHDYPHTLISCSGTDVGLPCGQMGNSEVGHLNMGAGRLVAQHYVRINRAIDDGSFARNPVLLDAIDHASTNEKAVHILGLLSPGGVHSHEHHLHAMVKLAAARGSKKIYVHAFLDGRDTAPQSAQSSLEKLQALFKQLGVGKLVSLIGRYYAMDRDHRWQRTQASYDLLTQGIAVRYVDDAITALEQAYAAGETDEFVQPTALYAQQKPIIVRDGDSIIFMNFRADRARQLTHAFVDNDFTGFIRAVRPRLADFVTLTEYAVDLNVNVAYRPATLNNVFWCLYCYTGF
jgi:2,3-bisphosphoglycerate-independent phosphoglycerate mutase